MKLSVEAKVAAAVAAGFLAVTVGVVAQGESSDYAGAPNESGAMIKSGVYSDANTQGYDADDNESGR